MNFLTLCQRTAYEAGVEGESVPTAVAAQTGELGRIVRWVKSAALDIDQAQLWSYLWEKASLTITGSTSYIAAVAGMLEDRYDTRSLYVNDGSPTWRYLEFVPWEEFRHDWRVLSANDQFRAWSIEPTGKLVFNAAATSNTSVIVDRWKLPVELAADADTPPMPADLHEIIVWRALVKYANFDEARVQRETAIDEYKTKYSALLRRCLRPMRLGGPLGDE